MKKFACFTHWDLDGVGCYILLRWAFPKAKIEAIPCTVDGFRPTFIKWLADNDMSEYDKIFIMDLDVSNDKDIVDKSGVFVIDHHSSHENASEYKKANSLVSSFSSATKLAYKAFVKLYKIKLNKPQKKLIALIDDYDSYTLAVPESKNLNIVFWGTDNRFEEFSKNFASGFHGFNYKQENMIKLYNEKLRTIRRNLDVYTGDIEIQGKVRRVCSAISQDSINDVADILLKDYDANVAIVVNPKTNHVSFRKSTTEYDKELDLSTLASTIADGAGHSYASGGSITEKFADFTKLLSPINS